jgi:hypothetical protein
MPAVVQSESYIPATDWGFKSFLQNFSTLITADPGRYGLDSADAAIIQSQYTGYAAAFDTVQAPTTRNASTIAQKDALRASAVASVRIYAQMIKVNQGVDNEDKIALGIHVNDPTPTPIPQPTTAPLLAIVAAFSGQHEIRYADETTPTSRAKPQGVIQMELRRTIAVGANPDPGAASPVGLFTKQPVIVEQDPADASKTATYFGRWVTRTGLVGPWSLPVAMTIAFGGPVSQEMPTGGQSITSGTSGGGDGEQLKIAA